MNKLRETLVQITIILLAATAVILAVMPLANTDWAESVRTGITAGAESGSQPDGFRSEGGEPASSGAIAYLASLIKIMLFMGVPGLITVGVLRLAKRKPKLVIGEA